MTQIIAIAAPIGGGKTSLAEAAAKELSNAALLFHDHYEKATDEPVEDLVQWLNNGADFNAFNLRELTDDLQALKQGKTIVDPLTHLEIQPCKYIIFEMPLGKAHAETAKFIDLLVWIDVPLDIALARKIREFTEGLSESNRPGSHRDHLVWIGQYIENYLNVVRKVLRVQKRVVRRDADVIIDGDQSITAMAEKAVREIRLRLG